LQIIRFGAAAAVAVGAVVAARQQVRVCTPLVARMHTWLTSRPCLQQLGRWLMITLTLQAVIHGSRAVEDGGPIPEISTASPRAAARRRGVQGAEEAAGEAQDAAAGCRELLQRTLECRDRVQALLDDSVNAGQDSMTTAAEAQECAALAAQRARTLAARAGSAAAQAEAARQQGRESSGRGKEDGTAARWATAAAASAAASRAHAAEVESAAAEVQRLAAELQQHVHVNAANQRAAAAQAAHQAAADGLQAVTAAAAACAEGLAAQLHLSLSAAAGRARAGVQQAMAAAQQARQHAQEAAACAQQAAAVRVEEIRAAAERAAEAASAASAAHMDAVLEFSGLQDKLLECGYELLAAVCKDVPEAAKVASNLQVLGAGTELAQEARVGAGRVGSDFPDMYPAGFQLVPRIQSWCVWVKSLRLLPD
jgi:hypothetical protein